MKNINYFRIIPLLIILMTGVLSSCKKDKDIIAPDAATAIAGQYGYSELTYNGKTLPANQTDLKGSVTLNRQTSTQVEISLDIRMKSSNSEFLVGSLDDVEVADKGDGNYSLSYEGEEFAQIKGKKLTFKGEDVDGVPFTIGATK
ncbi:hypothetical protein [Telluribacter sp. SYSU D00476]|uniref:hypothetical protein n=1 Tax=Telluribacter sp. SYSU D00476 TaxID=2811430 RepID=UPI001FF4CDF9|nr:hypothetical protein [Telluribacter sp. SYSU D00476]